MLYARKQSFASTLSASSASASSISEDEKPSDRIAPPSMLSRALAADRKALGGDDEAYVDGMQQALAGLTAASARRAKEALALATMIKSSSTTLSATHSTASIKPKPAETHATYFATAPSSAPAPFARPPLPAATTSARTTHDDAVARHHAADRRALGGDEPHVGGIEQAITGLKNASQAKAALTMAARTKPSSAARVTSDFEYR
jgi:hypothetical protein